MSRRWQGVVVHRFGLIPHDASIARTVRMVEASVAREGSLMRLTYAVDPAAAVIWPAPLPPARADGLWRATCFELFLRLDDDERYVEFNFAPSGAWAAYAFDGYRDGMAALACPTPTIQRTPDGVQVALDIGGLPRGELRMALTAVIAEEDGGRSFWSLAHPPGPPDFHHQACFAARLPAPATP